MQNNPTINRWWIVVAGAMGTAVGGGIVMLYAFGLLAKAFSTEFGWDRSVQAFCLTSYLVANGFGSIWLGSLINRWGVRRPAAAFIALFAASFAAISVLPASPWLFYLVFAVVGLSGAAATGLPYAVAVTGWFDRNRGLALGLVNTGAGLGAALGPHYASWLEANYGWRVGFVGVASLVGAVALFGLLVLVRDPPHMRTARSHSVASKRGPTLIEQLNNPKFWLIALPVLGVSIATFGVMGSLVPMLGDRDIDATTIAAVLSTAGVSSWVGRVLVGYTMDRVFAPYIAAITFVLALMGLGFISLAGPGVPLLVGAALVGFTLGAEGDLVTYLVSRYFSLESYSRVLGGIWVMWAWGGGLGTYLAGVTYGATGSYDTSMIVFAAVLILCTIIVCRLGPYLYSPQDDRTHHGREADQSTAA